MRPGPGRSRCATPAIPRPRWPCSTSSPAPSSKRPNTSISGGHRGRLGGNPPEVVALYERAVEADRNHAGRLFGLAMENDRRGNDEMALELYKRSAAQFPSHVGR